MSLPFAPSPPSSTQLVLCSFLVFSTAVDGTGQVKCVILLSNISQILCQKPLAFEVDDVDMAVAVCCHALIGQCY